MFEEFVVISFVKLILYFNLKVKKGIVIMLFCLRNLCMFLFRLFKIMLMIMGIIIVIRFIKGIDIMFVDFNVSMVKKGLLFNDIIVIVLLLVLLLYFFINVVYNLLFELVIVEIIVKVDRFNNLFGL